MLVEVVCDRLVVELDVAVLLFVLVVLAELLCERLVDVLLLSVLVLDDVSEVLVLVLREWSVEVVLVSVRFVVESVRLVLVSVRLVLVSPLVGVGADGAGLLGGTWAPAG